jgi:hypothetical protein
VARRIVVFAWVGFFVLGCGGDGAGLDLEGKWFDEEKDWGLEFIGGTIYELEDGARQHEAAFEIRSDGRRTILIIRDEDRTGYAIVEPVGEDVIRVTEPQQAAPGPDEDVPVVTLKRTE